ncbi:Spt20 family-domain-containing protein [Aspergillus californicus]
MTTAISKTTSYPPKMQRPPPPFVHNGINGVRSQQSSSSPAGTSKRLPGTGPSVAASSTSHPGMNRVNGTGSSLNMPVKGSLSRARKEAQKPGDQGTKLQKPMPKTSTLDSDRRLGKAFPEPYVRTSPYILNKFAKFPPSLILHLHPTHFRFEQQDGSFPYNSEMKVMIEHLRANTVPHDMMEELLRGNVRFYEGCLIVRVVDHKSVSAQTRKSTAPSANDNNTPFSIHNYNEHITPSAYVPYPNQNQFASEKVDSKETTADQLETKDSEEQADQSQDNSGGAGPTSQNKQQPTKPRVFTTVLHPTPRSLQAELTLLATTPDPKAARQTASASSSRPQMPSSTTPLSPGASSTQPERGYAAKRQKMLVESEDILGCEAKLTRALAPPLFLDPVSSLEGVHDLLKFLESPLHHDAPPSPKRRKRTVAELAADEALAAEEERFMLIMDERLEPTTSGAAGGPKSAAVDDAGGALPFEPRFSRFKTLENIRLQHEEKAKRDHEIKMKQELVKRQQQEQDKEKRRIAEQRQAEEQAKEEIRRQQLVQQQAQAQLVAQQQNRPVMAQTNGVSQAPQSSPVVRNQTPLNTSSPLVSSAMAAQNGVPMTMTTSMQGAGSPPRPPSALQHAHPNMMSHPMVPSRSQHSRHGTPQMTQGTPAMSQATPVMRNVTPTQRMSHASPPRSSIAPTPVMGQAMMATPQMGGGMNLTQQQQQQFLLQRQQMLAQQGHLNQSQLTPQQFAQLQANMHAQQQNLRIANPQAYQAQLMRAQLQQMQMAQQRQQQPQGQQQPQPQQAQMLQASPQMNPQQQQQQQHQQQQQQQMLMAAAQANGGQLPQNMQGMGMQQRQLNPTQRYSHLYQQRLLRLRQEMATRLMPQYGPPTQYPPQIAQEYSVGLEQAAKGFVHDLMRRDRAEIAAQQQRQAQAAAHQAQMVQQQQHNMMQNGMGK